VHIKTLKNRGRRPVANDVVTYSIAKDNQGRTRAVDATLAGEKPRKMAAQRSNRPVMIIAWLFLIVVGISCFLTELPLVVLGGWPGALLAQQTLRHKSKKGSFRVTLWFTALQNNAPTAMSQSIRSPAYQFAMANTIE